MKTEASHTEKFFLHTEKMKIYKMEEKAGQGMFIVVFRAPVKYL